MEQTAGTIESGKFADLVLLDANPLEDIRNTRRINLVISNGRSYDRKALWHSVKRGGMEFMSKSLLLGLEVLLLISVATGQDVPCKFKPAGVRVKVRDASPEARRVRRELEAVFARRVQAV